MVRVKEGGECDNGEVEDVKHKVMVHRKRRVDEEKERRLLVAAGSMRMKKEHIWHGYET